MRTLSPSAWVIFSSAPLAGAATSIVTLSVSSTTTGSSALIGSPTFLCHLPTTASVIDSPIGGTVSSTAILGSSPDRLFDDQLLFQFMGLVEAGRRARALHAPDVPDLQALRGD